MKKQVGEQNGYQIFKQYGVSMAVRSLLMKTVWGSGGTHYEHLGGEQTVKEMFDPHVITLEKDEELIACALFCKREVKVNSHTYNSFYTRYFAANPVFRGQGIVKQNGAATMSMIRKDVAEPSLFYAVVEKKNYASKKIVESVGYNPIALLKTVGISRYFPKKNSSVRKLSAAELEQMKLRLDVFYKEHGFVQFKPLDTYYVLEEAGEIVAGVQVEKGSWHIQNMPGVLGFVVMKVVPYIPLLNRIFNPRNFKFLGLEALYFKDGHAKDAVKLVEHLLAENKCNSAMLFADEKSKVYTHLMKCRLGILNYFSQDADSFLMMAHEHVPADEVASIQKAPVYVSSFDLL